MIYDGVIETWEREPNALVAVCIAKRQGSSPVTAHFSVMLPSVRVSG